MSDFIQLVARYHSGDNLVNYGEEMYTCICGYKSSNKYFTEQHSKNCKRVKDKMGSSLNNPSEDIPLTFAVEAIMKSCCSYDGSSSSSYDSGSSSYDGGGGSFDGGGSSGDW